MNFSTLPELLDYFKDKATCRQYLEQRRWNGNVECPFCAATKVYRTTRGFKCADRFCGKKFSVTVGTIFENSKVDLRTWFAAIYLCTSSKKGISSLQVHRQLGVTQKTAWFILHRVREMLRDKAPQMLKEEVQIDETYIGGKEKNKHANKRNEFSKGRSGTKIAVIGAYHKERGVINKVVPFVSKATVKDLVFKSIDKSAIMVTDALRSIAG